MMYNSHKNIYISWWDLSTSIVVGGHGSCQNACRVVCGIGQIFTGTY